MIEVEVQQRELFLNELKCLESSKSSLSHHLCSSEVKKRLESYKTSSMINNSNTLSDIIVPFCYMWSLVLHLVKA